MLKCYLVIHSAKRSVANETRQIPNQIPPILNNEFTH